MAKIGSICLFCGSRLGTDPRHSDVARRFGALVAARGVRLVFGGGHVGLMGVAADAALGGGGEVVGVIPEHLRRRELGHQGVDLRVVATMHARKNLMFELSDAFAVLPGGIGTLDECFEIVTWKQLGLHDKPILLVDEDGYWEPFTALLGHMVDAGFALIETPSFLTRITAVEHMFEVLDRLPEPAHAGNSTKF